MTIDAPGSLLDTALARVRSGWRIRHEGESFVVYGPHGDQGVSENAAHALNYYMWLCAHGPQQPQPPTYRDILPCEQEVSDVLDDRLNLVHWSEL